MSFWRRENKPSGVVYRTKTFLKLLCNKIIYFFVLQEEFFCFKVTLDDEGMFWEIG